MLRGNGEPRLWLVAVTSSRIGRCCGSLCSEGVRGSQLPHEQKTASHTAAADFPPHAFSPGGVVRARQDLPSSDGTLRHRGPVWGSGGSRGDPVALVPAGGLQPHGGTGSSLRGPQGREGMDAWLKSPSEDSSHRPEVAGGGASEKVALRGRLGWVPRTVGHTTRRDKAALGQPRSSGQRLQGPGVRRRRGRDFRKNTEAVDVCWDEAGRDEASPQEGRRGGRRRVRAVGSSWSRQVEERAVD